MASSIRYEAGGGDVADAAIGLHLIGPVVEIIQRQQLAGSAPGDARFAEIPDAAVRAQDELAPPAAALVLAEPGADAEGRHAVAVDAGDAAVGEAHDVARCAPVVDAREEAPGAAAVLALVDLGPEDAGGIALRAQRAQD